MSNIVKKKQKRTLIINSVLAVVVLACLIFVGCDGFFHMNDPYRSFKDADFAAAFAEALGKESVRDLTQEDIDKVESLVYYYDVGVDEENSYQTTVYPIVMLGYKEATDKLIESEWQDAPSEGSFAMVSYPISEVEDITLFKNLRVLRTFDLSEVSAMQEGCAETQNYAMYSQYSTQFQTQAVTLDMIVQAASLSDLKKLDQLSSLTKLEELSLEYTGLTSLAGIEKFENLKKLDIGNTKITDISPLSNMTGLDDLTIVQMGERPVATEDESEENTEEEKHTHAGLTDLGAIKNLTNLKQLNFSANAVSDLSPLSGMTQLETLIMIDNCVENLDALSGITTLTGISAANNHLTNIEGIKNSTALTVFEAYGNKIENIGALADCTKLENIIVYDNAITEIGDLSKLTALTAFTANNNKIKNISTLAGCTALETITVNDNEIEEIGTLSALKSLITFTANNNKIKNLNGLNGCEKLETITANDNLLAGELDLTQCAALKTLNIQITVEDEKEEDKEGENTEDNKEETVKAEGISNLIIKDIKTLTTVSAGGNALTAVPDITGCEALATLSLANNKITDVAGAANGKALVTLDLTGNQITDISKLETVTTLTTLNLSKNNITDIKAVEKLTSLKTLTLDDNKDLEDISAINSFPTTSALSLSILRTKAAENETAVKELAAKYTSMKITYTETTEKK